MAAKRINLALQGGGSHGAFTWGVLDKLLEDGRFTVEGMSGTSAGAMNAAAAAQGLASGGLDGARKCLETLWKRVSGLTAFAPVPASAYDTWFGNFSLLPGVAGLDLIAQLAHSYSPYSFTFAGAENPLRELAEELFDFGQIRAVGGPALYIAATNVYTGKVRVFTGAEVNADVLAASSCLPQMFRAVEIDGEPYWDGGFRGNPALFPLYYDAGCDDILLVQVNPVERRELPKTRAEIDNRVDEVAFNGALLSELRAVEFVQRLLDEGKLTAGEGYSRVRMHRVGGEELTRYGAATKLRTDWTFLTELRDLGRASAAAWLETHAADVGERGTLDLKSFFG